MGYRFNHYLCTIIFSGREIPFLKKRVSPITPCATSHNGNFLIKHQYNSLEYFAPFGSTELSFYTYISYKS